ncbi:MAG: flagellar protein FlaG [Proteobacteria bacterium]|nr:flagellar protein FlaG [Pseudomonadota bacterium]
MEIKVQQPIAPPTNAGSGAPKSSRDAAVRIKPTSPSSPERPPPTSAGATLRSQQAKDQDLRQVVEELQRRVQSTASNLHFSIDTETGRTVVKVTDANTQEVIRQIPAEEILRLDKALEHMQGLLLNKRG